MSLVRKLLVFGLGGLVALVVVAYVAIQITYRSRMGATFEQPVIALSIPEGDAAAIARGEYLVSNVLGCSHSECHRPDLGGGAVIDAPPMGLVYAPNLTAGRGTVTAGYTGEDWARILRHGLTRAKRRALVMPSEDYPGFSDADLASAVAFIKNQPPVDRETRAHNPGLLARFLLSIGELQFAHEKIDHTARPDEAAPGPTREWGAVLSGTCKGCHGDGLSGGPIPGGDPSWPEARNISPDEATGIGRWSFAEFDTVMRRGKRPDGTDVRAPMPWQTYAGMKDDDLKAMWEYLRTVPAKPAGGR